MVDTLTIDRQASGMLPKLDDAVAMLDSSNAIHRASYL